MQFRPYDRRTVLKTLGAGILGGTAITGTVQAGDTGNERRQDSFAWANNTLYEMLEPEPHPPTKDEEGDDDAHRPLWVIASMAGTGEPGSDHSPHPNPDDLPIDHVVPLVDFSAQWHVHLVHEAVKDSSGAIVPGPLTRETSNRGFLTSAADIRGAVSDGDVLVIETPTVFTCPIRPHHHLK